VVCDRCVDTSKITLFVFGFCDHFIRVRLAFAERIEWSFWHLSLAFHRVGLVIQLYRSVTISQHIFRNIFWTEQTKCLHKADCPVFSVFCRRCFWISNGIDFWFNGSKLIVILAMLSFAGFREIFVLLFKNISQKTNAHAAIGKSHL